MNATAQAALIAGGIFHLALAAFHMAFWKMFRWRDELPRLGAINRAVMQILNVRITYLFIAFAALSFIFPEELAGTPLGRSLLIVIALFWAMRAAEQVVFFGLRNRRSLALFVLCLAGASLYALPVLVR